MRGEANSHIPYSNILWFLESWCPKLINFLSTFTNVSPEIQLPLIELKKKHKKPNCNKTKKKTNQEI